MGRKSSVSRLEPEIRAYIEAMLATGSMTLDELIEDLREKFPLQAQAGGLPSRSAIGRYGQKLERRLVAVRAATEGMRLIREHAGDEMDVRSEGLLALIQTELFEVIVALQEADDPEIDQEERLALLSNAAKHMATLTRASVNLKRFQAEAEERARKKAFAEAAEQAAETAKQQGLSKTGVDALRAAIMGKL